MCPARSSGERLHTDEQELRRGSPLTAVLALASLAAAGALLALVPELRHAVAAVSHGDLAGLRRQFHGLGASGVVLLLALMLAHALIFYPTEVVTATAGFVYGFLPGFALALGGWLASALLSYAIGAIVGRPLLHRLFGGPRFMRLENAVARGGASLLLGVRLVPILPFSLTGYVAGAARVPLWRFSWTTLVGYLPLTAIVAYLGSQAESLSASDPRAWIGGVALLALLAAGRLVKLERAAAPSD